MRNRGRWRQGGRGRPGGLLSALPAALPAIACGAALVLLSGCGSASAEGTAAGATPTSSGQVVTVAARPVPGAGTVLVSSNGYALYVFAPDNHREVTCTGACAGTWPPLMLPSGATPKAGPGVKQSLLGSVSDPAGGQVVTYDGWPLYGYTGDVQPGQATGQDIDLNGGEWYVIRPSGQPLIPAP
jgi:predicted lipoprotein with Yx(FWY)xxD motif